MATEFYPGAIQMLVPRANVFWDTNPRFAIVIHGTAGWNGASAQDVAQMFATIPDKRSSHFIIGRDGTVVQCVSLADGAGANCCLEPGYDPFWDQDPRENKNPGTISIEHVKWTTDNSDPLTDVQKQASFKLVKWLYSTLGISASHIKGHNSIAPKSRALCPGNYPMKELITFIETGGTMIPSGWKDDGTTLTAPNGVTVVSGFRNYLLNYPGGWIADNYPLSKEFHANPLEFSNPALGAGQKQCFRRTTLEYTKDRGVFEAWQGQEVYALTKELAKVSVPPVTPPTPTIPASVRSDLEALRTATNAAITNVEATLGITQ